MLILTYGVLILLASLVTRGFQMLDGQYFDHSTAYYIEDGISLVFLGLIMVALVGYARRRQYLSRTFWKGYFILILVTIPIAPFVSAKYGALIQLSGYSGMLAAYGLSTLLALPLLWGLYAYSFRSPDIWMGGTPQPQQA